MKSHKSESIQVRWLIGEIGDLDKMIAMHRSADGDFMAEQYEARRLKYFKELISLLANSAYNVSGRETFPLIEGLLKENYPKRRHRSAVAGGHKSFEQVLHFYETRKAKSNVTSTDRSGVVAEPDAIYRKK